MKHPRTVLITGATGGIGSALARAYAAPGQTLILHGRDTDRLDAVAGDCRARGAEVETQALDLRDIPGLRAWLAEAGGRHAIDLAIVNAGITSNIGDDAAGEGWPAIEQVVAINLTAALATADAVLPAMRRHGRGQIAFVSSLSAYFGLPLTPSYGATKAALKSYGEAWRGWLDAEGIGVTVVCPGFVESAMSQRFNGPRPFLMTAEDAADLIKRRLARNPARISFPFPLNLGIWWLAVLPPAWSLKILGWLGFGGRAGAEIE
jgi:short-subunit dehydrogenase